MIVALTLSSGALPGLAAGMRERGARVRVRPLLRVCLVSDLQPLRAALATLGPDRALAVTSPRAALAVRRLVEAPGLRPPETTWAIGPATARALPADWPVRCPATADARSLAHTMLEAGVRGAVLHPCGAERREELATELARVGVTVEPLVCYRIELAAPAEIRRALIGADLAVIGSPRLILRAAESLPISERPPLLCLGPTTAASARRSGWEVAAVAQQPTTTALLSAFGAVLRRTAPVRSAQP